MDTQLGHHLLLVIIDTENFTARAHRRNYSKPGHEVLQVEEVGPVVQGANLVPAELLLLFAGSH